jgi:beta-galactosidase
LKKEEYMSSAISRRNALKGIATIASVSVLSKTGLAEVNSVAHPHTAGEPRERSFDDGWRFKRGDVTGAENPAFSDLAWRKLDLPHDWSIEDLPPHPESDGRSALWDDTSSPTEIGPFSKLRSEGKGATGWVVGGIGWYRKSFATPEHVKGDRVAVRFDGVYMNAEFWINGTKLGQHPYGYTSFEYNLTPHLREGGENVLAVKVNNAGSNSRWYSGAGIYRHVWLTVTGPVYVPTWGVFVVTKDASREAAALAATVQVTNAGSEARDVKVRLRLLDADGQVANSTETRQIIQPGGPAEVKLAPVVNQPRLWSPTSPNLYSAEVEILVNDRRVDRVSTNIGIRKLEVDVEHGLRINGETFKLRGGCLHHDNGVLGSATIDRAEERRVELMKSNGFNAIRTSHNPPSPAFLDACDRLGIMVLDEAFDMWEAAKNPGDYHLYFKEWWQRDLDAMVLRDRNHPSIVIWSIGNEVSERAAPEGVAIAKRLTERLRQLDSTRPITQAIPFAFESIMKTGKMPPWPSQDPAFKYLDVGGYNYEWKQFEKDHDRLPERVMVETESYPIQAAEVWEAVNKLPYVLGDFVWTGMDYIGESGIGIARLTPAPSRFRGAAPPAPPMSIPAGIEFPFPNGVVFGDRPDFPWFNSYCGDIDLIGNKKPQSYFRDVVWDRSKIEMAVLRPLPEGRKEQISAWGWFDELRSWTWPGQEGLTLTVRVYTKGDRVQLLLNGKEVGSADVSTITDLPAGKTIMTAELTVPYAAGELKAVALKDGKPIAQTSLKTAGAPHRITLHPDRLTLKRSRNDLSFVMVHVEDNDGNLVPDAVADISFKLLGTGELAAVGNANPKEIASFRLPRRKTYQGRCLAVVRPTGTAGSITLQANSEGLEPASVALRVG